MPTYEYLCQNCGHRFEAWQKMSDEPLTVCPNCQGEIRRVLFPAGVVFKGSGFYITDSARSSSLPGPAATNTTSENAPAAPSSTGETSSTPTTSKE